MTGEGLSPQRGDQDKRLKYSAAGAAVGAAAAAGTYGMMHGRELTQQRRTTEVSTRQSSLSAQLRDSDSAVRSRRHQFSPSAHAADFTAQISLLAEAVAKTRDRAWQCRSCRAPHGWGLSISGPTARMDDSFVRHVIPLMTRTAAEISGKLSRRRIL